jgi:hypothetical protein
VLADVLIESNIDERFEMVVGLFMAGLTSGARQP